MKTVNDAVILVVDDTPVVREGTALMVGFMGFDAEQAAGGEEALAKLKTGSYGAVLMDYNMPGMSGFECTAQIRKMENGTGKRIPIIGMTASTDQDIREACLNAGMDDYIDKSCSNAELQELLAKWVPACTFVK